MTGAAHTDNVYIFVFYCYIRVLLIKPSSMIYCMLYIKYAEKVARRLRGRAHCGTR